MRKLRIFFVELVLIAIVVGWFLMRSPDSFDVYIPYILAAIAWHLFFECFWQSETIKAWRKAKQFSRLIDTSIFLAVSLLLCAGGWFAGKQLVAVVSQKQTVEIHQPDGEKPKGIPHLTAYLTVGKSLKKSQPTLVVTNIGSIPVGSIQSAMDAGNGQQFDGVPSSNELQPLAKTTIPFAPLFSSSAVLSFVLVYEELPLGGGIKHYARFKFYVAGTTPETPLYPTFTDEGKGDPGIETAMNQMLLRFNEKIGSIVLTVPENKSDGSPNIISLASHNKLLLINPATRTASLSCAYPTGNMITKFSFKPTSNAVHVAVVTWDDGKREAVLYIDGKAHTPKNITASAPSIREPCAGHGIHFYDTTNTNNQTGFLLRGNIPCFSAVKTRNVGGGTGVDINSDPKAPPASAPANSTKPPASASGTPTLEPQ